MAWIRKTLMFIKLDSQELENARRDSRTKKISSVGCVYNSEKDLLLAKPCNSFYMVIGKSEASCAKSVRNQRSFLIG